MPARSSNEKRDTPCTATPCTRIDDRAPISTWEETRGFLTFSQKNHTPVSSYLSVKKCGFLSVTNICLGRKLVGNESFLFWSVHRWFSWELRAWKRSGNEVEFTRIEWSESSTGQTRYFPETISVEPLDRNAARVHVLLWIATCSLRQLLLRTRHYGSACTPSYLNSNRAGGWAALRWLVEQFLLESYLVVLGILSGQFKTSVSLIACTVVMANLLHSILSQRLQLLTMFFLSFISIRVSDFLRSTTSNNLLDYVLIERNRQR